MTSWYLTRSGKRRHVHARGLTAICQAQIAARAEDESLPVCGNCQRWLAMLELIRDMYRRPPPAMKPPSEGQIMQWRDEGIIDQDTAERMFRSLKAHREPAARRPDPSDDGAGREG